MIKSKSRWFNRSTIGWVFYDWANSAFSTTVMAGFFPIFFKSYFSKGTPTEESSFKLGIAYTVSSIMVGLFSPISGAIADAGAYKKRFLAAFTLLAITFTALLAGISEGSWALAILIYVSAFFCHSASLAFYDSLLPSVAERNDLDWVSSLGFGVGYLGGGLLFALNVWMYLNPAMFGLESGIQAVKLSFLMVAIWWAIFSIPLLLWTQERPALVSGPKTTFTKQVAAAFAELRKTLSTLKRYKTILLFLTAFFLYNDGVGTTIKMSVDYGMSIGFKPADLITALLLVQFIGFPAALGFGWATRHVHPKKALLFAVGVYVVITAWGSQMTESREFYVLAAMIGLVQGGVQALSRSFYARLIPTDRAGEFYGFFSLLGRFGGIIGPVLMGGVAYLNSDPRLGLLSINLLFIPGALLLFFVNEAKSKTEIGSAVH
jgi:UMF1 family MFS transporter